MFDELKVFEKYISNLVEKRKEYEKKIIDHIRDNGNDDLDSIKEHIQYVQVISYTLGVLDKMYDEMIKK